MLEDLEEYGIEPGSICYILNTHKHPDHYLEQSVNKLTNLGAQFVELQA